MAEDKKDVKLDAEALAAEMEKRKLAAEEAKKEAARKKEERAKAIAERVGEMKNIDGLEEKDLRDYMHQCFDRVMLIEVAKYDLERKVQVNNIELQDLKKKVMDLRGKFIIPSLKKVVIDFE